MHNKFLLHGLSRHCTFDHPDLSEPFRITPIKKREIFLIYKLKSLQNTHKERSTSALVIVPNMNPWMLIHQMQLSSKVIMPITSFINSLTLVPILYNIDLWASFQLLYPQLRSPARLQQRFCLSEVCRGFRRTRMRSRALLRDILQPSTRVTAGLRWTPSTLSLCCLCDYLICIATTPCCLLY